MPSRCEECGGKHKLIVEHMQAHGLDAVVLTRRCNFAWLTAGGLNHVSTAADAGNASLLVTPEQIVCVTNTIEAPRMAEEELREVEVPVRSYAWHDAAEATRAWSDLNGRSVACDVRVAGLPDSVRALDSSFDMLRWSLSEDEVVRHRALARDVAQVLETACRMGRPGMSEFQLAASIAAGLRERGARTPVILVAADERIRDYRHPIPTPRRFERYGMGVCTGERHGLMVSATRLFCFGAIPEDLRRRHEAVCRVDAAMIAATRPGRTLGEVFAVAQRAYAENGFPTEWQHHHQGGSTGYQGRDVKAVPGSPVPVLAQQAFAWNPSIAGTKSEDTMLVGPDSNEILSVTGDWPAIACEAASQRFCRPDILRI